MVEIDVVVWVVEIDSISVWWIGRDLIDISVGTEIELVLCGGPK